MTATAIGTQIAWMNCTHKKSGTPACNSCITKYTEDILDTIGIHVIKEAAKFFEPKTRQDRITPLTWCQAYTICLIVLKADRR